MSRMLMEAEELGKRWNIGPDRPEDQANALRDFREEDCESEVSYRYNGHNDQSHGSFTSPNTETHTIPDW